MRYFSLRHGENEPMEISKDEARFLLEGCYKKEFVDEILSAGEDKGFRLRTPYRDVWTKTDEGLVPIAGFYGTVG